MSAAVKENRSGPSAPFWKKKHSSDRIRGMTRLYKVVFAANREAIFFNARVLFVYRRSS